MAEHFDIRLADMTSKRRPENIAFPRQVAMFLSRQMTENSLSAIGEAFGGRDHGTVLHACRLVKDRMEVDANVRQVVHYLEKQYSGDPRRCWNDPAVEFSGRRLRCRSSARVWFSPESTPARQNHNGSTRGTFQ